MAVTENPYTENMSLALGQAVDRGSADVGDHRIDVTEDGATLVDIGQRHRRNQTKIVAFIHAIYQTIQAESYRLTYAPYSVMLEWKWSAFDPAPFADIYRLIERDKREHDKPKRRKKGKTRKGVRKMDLDDRMEVEISCPKCSHDTKLIVRTNKANGNQFLGCPNFPECNHSQPIPEYLYMKRAGQASLFDDNLFEPKPEEHDRRHEHGFLEEPIKQDPHVDRSLGTLLVPRD